MIESLATLRRFAPLGALLWHAGVGDPRQDRRSVSIVFEPRVAGAPFVCGRSYPRVSIDRDTITPLGFLFFIHQIRLLAADGREVPLALDQNEFQNADVALLDFENGAGPCAGGTVGMHTVVSGSVPRGPYVGIRFMLGLPTDRNHRDPSAEPAPLGLMRKTWSPAGGHDFLRFDARSSNGKLWAMHLRSTDCTLPIIGPNAPPPCAHENQVSVSLSAFDVDTDAIVADAAALFADSSGADQVCLSTSTAAPCRPMLAALGIPTAGHAVASQRFLTRRSDANVRGKAPDAPVRSTIPAR